MPAQPQDEWTYLRPEEFSDDDAVERIEEACESSPEESAVHELDLEAGEPAGTALDPGETVERTATQDDAPTQYFDDEEPDRSPDGEVAETESEPGVDDLLVSQHYTFDPDGQ